MKRDAPPNAPTAPRRYVTASEVARLAGVSQPTVSRTFVGHPKVSEETRRKVLQAAEQLSYRPSAIPRIMFTDRSNLVAVAAGELHNPLWAALLDAYTRRLQAAGLQILLFKIEDSEGLEALIPRLASYRVDAIFITRCVVSADLAAEFRRSRIPVVSFNTRDRNDGVSSVCPDDYAGGEQVAELFLRRDAGRIAFVGRTHKGVVTAERLHGFRDRLERDGRRVLLTTNSELTYEAGLGAGLEMLSDPRRPDAVFCANDLLALGLLDAARKLGLAVPEELIVAGFDDIPQAAWGAYNLTTMRQDINATVEASLDIFARLMEPEGAESRQVLVTSTLIERNSTRRLVSQPRRAAISDVGFVRPTCTCR